MAEENFFNRFTKIYILLWSFFVLAALVAFVLYKFGYRLTNQLEPVKVGSIELSSNETGLQIFFDNREQRAPFENGRYVFRNITPGFHSLVISKDGFWPWAKTVAVSQNNIRELYAFIFPMDGLVASKLSPVDPQYMEARKIAADWHLPEVSSEAPPFTSEQSLAEWLANYAPKRKLSNDKNTALFLQNNTIYVAWVSETLPPPHYFCEENPCKLLMPVVVPEEPVKSLDFYKGRGDTLIFASGPVIYAIEVDREGTQNFQPLYKDKDPSFYETASGSLLYIKDGGLFYSAAL